MSFSHGRVQRLREVYMDLGKSCHDLADINRETNRDEIEQIRANVATAQCKLWLEIRRLVMVDWCNETDTPEPFSKFPPKDMPQDQKAGEDT